MTKLHEAGGCAVDFKVALQDGEPDCRIVTDEGGDTEAGHTLCKLI